MPDPDPQQPAPPPPAAPSAAPPPAAPLHEAPQEADAAATDLAAAPLDDEPLPDWVELTPELMEDECLRGDAMLRGAVMLLALLLGWTYITHTRVLVSIRTGEDMLSGGFLPPRVDSYSATAAGRPWINLSWLSDLILGGVHQSLGMGWLSALAAATVAAAFWSLSQISLPKVSTWWASVCLATAAVALFPVFQPGAATATVLGLGLLMLVLAHWQLDPGGRVSWGLPALFLVWTNLDSRAWLGLLLLLAFAPAALLSRSPALAAQRGRNALIVAAALLAGLLATPWPGQPALAGIAHLREAAEVRAYLPPGAVGVEPGVDDFFTRQVFGLAQRGFWQAPDAFTIAALALLLAASATALLNFRRPHWGWLAAGLAVNLVSLGDGYIVCYAAIVNATLAIWQGQDWYRHTFRNEFATDRWSVAYARGGRAATVLCFFLIAYLAANGALMGPSGRRLGIGLDPRWQNRISSLEEHVLVHAYGERFFPTLPDQGDLLLWLGKKPFVDSRLGLYAGGERNLLQLHRDVRASLFRGRGPDDQPADPDAWKPVLSEFEIYDVFSRLWGAAPPYAPVLTLLANRDWALTGLGAAGANFTRRDLELPALQAHVAAHEATRFVERAFRPEFPPQVTELTATFPTPVSAYDRWLLQRLPVVPNPAELARHYDRLQMELGYDRSPHQVAALAQLAIRSCRAALQENPNDPTAYRVLLDAYLVLGNIEQRAAMIGGFVPDNALRNTQALAAAYHAAQASGNSPLDLQNLFWVQYAQQKLDVALKTANQLFQKTGKRPTPPGGGNVEDVDELVQQLAELVDEVRGQMQEIVLQGGDRFDLIAMAMETGCPEMALGVIEEDRVELLQNSGLQVLRGQLLLDVGRTSEGHEQLERISQMIPPGDAVPPQAVSFVTRWRNAAALANLAGSQTDRAVQLWQADARMHQRSSVVALLQQPFAAAQTDLQQDLWAAGAARASLTSAIEIPEQVAILNLQSALADLETGRLARARETLQTILRQHPEFSRRPLVAFYLMLLTGEDQEAAPPPREAPTANDGFPPQEVQLDPEAESSGDASAAPGSSEPESPALPMPVDETAEPRPVPPAPAPSDGTESP